ncbi:MAG: hypothetical protein J7K40_15220 [candidate division Zixibacteria bacterium]|nr:hypothetical protein [candidate division Zixibacteria bacterium]
MATSTIQPGASDGYQIVVLPDGSLLITQFEALAENDIIEWDDEFAAASGWAGKLLDLSVAKLNDLTIADILS